MFMSAVVLETAVFDDAFSNTPYSFVFFRAAPVYYAVFFRVRLLLSAYDSLVPDPGSRSRLQPRAQIEHSARGKVL